MRCLKFFRSAFTSFGALAKLGAARKTPNSGQFCVFVAAALFILWVTLIDIAMPVPDLMVEPLYLLPILFVFWKTSLQNSFVIALFCLLAYFVSRESGGEGLFKSGTSSLNLFISLSVLVYALGIFVKIKGRLSDVERQAEGRECALRWKSRKLEILEKELLQISESQRIEMAGELHDGLAQDLLAVAFKCRMLQEDLQSEGSAHAGSLVGIIAMINQSVRQSRQIASNLMPADLGSEGLVEALRRFASRAEGNYQMVCLFKHTGGQPRLSQPVSLHLLRIVQEAFSNAVRHGKARHVEIHLDCAGDDFQLLIQDMGYGFKLAEVSHPGLGLRLMRLRASLAGLNLRIFSRPSRGTRIEVSSKEYRSGAGRGGDMPETEIMQF